ncbi:hypothetical protein AVEN_195093-1 [Araneus ventricosus]|uniref:Uncharacterized protein n=1 Tax=Araneus ventricosus TaxID=182803 RepID=A0A4Y2BGV5_ARAVE|nr:hypothetical protein AVEN_195093-1 [Araneus ventricosus]
MRNILTDQNVKSLMNNQKILESVLNLTLSAEILDVNSNYSTKIKSKEDRPVYRDRPTRLQPYQSQRKSRMYQKFHLIEIHKLVPFDVANGSSRQCQNTRWLLRCITE